MAVNTSSSIPAGLKNYFDAAFLSRAQANCVIDQFATQKTLPDNSSKTYTFKRIEKLPINKTPLVEGVTPSGSTSVQTSIDVVLEQKGDFQYHTDVMLKTGDKNLAVEIGGAMGQQCRESLEASRYDVLIGGTNVVYANKVANRSSIVSVISKDDLNTAVRTLNSANAKKITEFVKSTPNYATQPVNHAYVAVLHPDQEFDVRNLTGFISVELYSTPTDRINGEIGKLGDVRFVTSSLVPKFANAGGAAGANISTNGTNADIYPMFIFGKEAFGIVNHKSQSSYEVGFYDAVSTDSDPMAQRARSYWKVLDKTVILNNAFMIRIESAVKN